MFSFFPHRCLSKYNVLHVLGNVSFSVPWLRWSIWHLQENISLDYKIVSVQVCAYCEKWRRWKRWIMSFYAFKSNHIFRHGIKHWRLDISQTPAHSICSNNPPWLRLIVRLYQRSEIISQWSDTYIIFFKQVGIIPIQMKMNVRFASFYFFKYLLFICSFISAGNTISCLYFKMQWCEGTL